MRAASSPSPSPNACADLAARLKAAQDSATQLTPPSSQNPGFDLDAGYAVAHALYRARLAEGAVPVGRKIGFTNPAIWDQYGVHAPIWGRVYAHTLQQLSGAPATCALGAFAEPRIEPEIVLHLASAPPAGADAVALLACIDWVAHGFEVVQSHFPGWRFQPADTVADGGLHARLLLGPPVPVADLGADPAAALAAFRLELECDGKLVERGGGANVLGSPLLAAAHLLHLLARQAPLQPLQPLQAGELVSTGTLTGAWPLQPGQRWRTTLAGIALPGLDVRFVA